MKITGWEEILSTEIQEYCTRQRQFLEGMVFFGRLTQKAKGLPKDDPIIRILSHAEEALSLVRSFNFIASQEQAVLFLEYRSVKYGTYNAFEDLTEPILARVITLFYAEFTQHIVAIRTVLEMLSEKVKFDDRLISFYPFVELNDSIMKLSKIQKKYFHEDTGYGDDEG